MKKIIWVQWVDAEIEDEKVLTLAQAKKLKCPIIETVGWLVDDNGERTILCADIDRSDDWHRGTVVIPNVCIVDHQIISIGRQRKKVSKKPRRRRKG